MKNRRFNIFIGAMLALLPMITSCRQELCYDHYPVLNIDFAWEREWERDYGMDHINNWNQEYYGCGYDQLRPSMPEWVNMVSYHTDGRVVNGFMPIDGKQFIVEAGESRSMLLYNGDTEYIILSDVASVNDARAEATSRSRSRASLEIMYQKHVNARTTNPPDILYSAFIENVRSLQNHEQEHMQIKMQPLVYTYHITYEFDYGLEHVALVRGALGGVAESVYLRTGATSDETAIVLFDCEKADKCCRAQVRSFGIPGFPDEYYGRTISTSDERPYTLNLEVMLRNGKTIEYNFDITDQMKNQPRGGVIKVSGLKIEDSEGQVNSGFETDVSDWNDSGEVIDLPLGNQPGAK